MIKKLTDEDMGKKVTVIVRNENEDKYKVKLHAYSNEQQCAIVDTTGVDEYSIEQFVNVPYSDLTLGGA